MKRYLTVSALHMHSHSPGPGMDDDGMTDQPWLADLQAKGRKLICDHQRKKSERTTATPVDNDDTQFCGCLASWQLAHPYPVVVRGPGQGYSSNNDATTGSNETTTFVAFKGARIGKLPGL